MSSKAANRWRSACRGLWRFGVDYLPDFLAFVGALLVAGLTALLVSALPGCGGVGSEGTGSYASGPITGLGSIIVNGTRFDDSLAAVVDDDGEVLDRSALALGMTVQVLAGPISVDDNGWPVAGASSVRVVRALVGPLMAVDAAAGRLVVLGQQVQLGPDTVFDPAFSGGPAGLTPGRRLQVYGFYDDALAAYVATRIAPAAEAGANRVRGPVRALDSASQTFVIGSQRYSYAALASGGEPTEGSVLRIDVQLSPDVQGRWQVSRRGVEAAAGLATGSALDLRGLVPADGDGRQFTIDGVSIDLRGAHVDGSVAPGAAVHVTGTWHNATLVASRVSVDSGTGGQRFTMIGNIAALDTGAQRLDLRGIAIGYGRADLVVERGTLADLSPGRQVQIDAVLSDDRTRLEATRIRFLD